jgi:hypothetical protein
MKAGQQDEAGQPRIDGLVGFDTVGHEELYLPNYSAKNYTGSFNVVSVGIF